ncbi:hypothetical protein BOX15_Mlig000020g2, partial [Macrostomum lignano]
RVATMQCISCSPFSIIHCSSQDAGHPATALQSPSPWSTGWLSAKFCLYPQELVLGLEEPLKVRKIQLVSHPHCIASKVEFYIGDCPPDEPRHVNNVRWSRLGHVALLSNQSGKQRRELKSIHLEANGSFVKLSLHSNHSNAERNPYNQVGIIALAIQSQPLDADDDEASKSTLAAAAAAYQSPYVDLGFDLTCHPRLVQLIRELDWEKQQLVAKELLGAAKGVQARISAAVSAGQELAELELDKAKAIAIEDYGLAEDYKIAIQNKLDAAVAAANAIAFSPAANAPVPNDTAYNEANKEESASELPSVAMDTARTERQSEIGFIDGSTGGGATDRRNVLALSYDDTPLPTLQNQTVNEEDEQPGSGGRKSADAINEQDVDGAETAVDQTTSDTGALPSDLLAKARSTSRSMRAEALSELTNLVGNFGSDSNNNATPGEFYQAVLAVCQRGFEDAAVTVHEAALPLGRALLVGFVDRHNLPGSDLHYGCCRLVPPLLVKLGDTAARIRDSSREFLLEMAGWPKVRQMPDAAVVHLCLRPMRRGAATLERQAVARVQLASALYKQLGLSAKSSSKAAKSGGGSGGEGGGEVSLGALLTFGFSALSQRHAETRRAAEALLLEVASQPDCRDRVKRRLAKATSEAADASGGGGDLPAFKSLAAKLN